MKLKNTIIDFFSIGFYAKPPIDTKPKTEARSRGATIANRAGASGSH